MKEKSETDREKERKYMKEKSKREREKERKKERI